MKNTLYIRSTLIIAGLTSALLPATAFAGIAAPSTTPVPTLGTLGLIGLGATLGALGIRYFKSRNK